MDNYIRTYGRRLYGLCRTLCPNPDDADDLYQETWLKAMENISRYDKAREFEPWITKICVNSYRNILRRLKRSPIFNGFHSTADKELFLKNVRSEPPEDYSDLHAAIERLPDPLRITIILFYFRDMDIKSVSEVLAIPPGTVKSRLNRAKKRLKEGLIDDAAIQF